MPLDKETLGKIISVILTAVVALLAIAGYHVTVIAPAMQVLTANAAACAR